MISSVVKGVLDTVRGAAVMCRAGLVPLLRPDHGLRSLLSVQRFGFLVGANDAALHRHPDRVALVDERGPLTHRELDSRSTALARAWSRRGLRCGSVVAVLCRNHRGLVLAMLAAGKLGARVVLMNTGFAGPQLVDVTARENVTGFVYDEEFAGLLDDLPGSVDRYLSWVEDTRNAGGAIPALEDLIADDEGGPLPAPARPGGLVLLTSGTTGAPKGAPRPRISPLDSVQFLDRIPLRAQEATYMGAPIFHATGLSQFVLSLALGSTVVMRRKFDPEETLRGVAGHRCTALVLIPTMLQRIVDLGSETLRQHDTSSLRAIVVAGSALAPDLGNRATEAFGEVLYNLYGSTEVAVATVATPQDWRQAPGTVGRPPVGCTVALYDSDGARITRPNVTGRVFVGSHLSFGGYSGGGSKDSIDDLLASGDVGHLDDHGLLFIDGRDDDMIVSGGENVYPLEIENLLVQREDVLEAAVIGVPDPEFGQRLKAFVVPAPGAALDADTVRAFVKSNLARYKVPRDVDFLEELPRNATGKVLRDALQ
jgi:fatty-acyl-CoA synthase